MVAKSSRTVRRPPRDFFDVGALYGYYSIVSQSIFSDVDAICVEANPNSSQAIETILTKLPEISKRITVKNTLLSNKSKPPTKHMMFGFSAIEKYSLKWFKMYLKQLFKTAKASVGFETRETRETRPVDTVKIPEMTFEELIETFQYD